MLKAQLHIHANEDINDPGIKYSAKDLIDEAKKLNFDVLSFTFHDQLFYNDEIVNYAKSKNILLIPGIEKSIEGRHVLIIGLEKLPELNTLQDLNKIKNSALIIAPHPFFPKLYSLRKKLTKNVNVFHGIEFSFFYTKYLNFFNKKAVKLAKKHNLLIIGTSDVHKIKTLNYTYTLIDSKKNISDIITAIKNNKIKVKTKPMPLIKFIPIILWIFTKKLIPFPKKNLRKKSLFFF